jgi:hypothetical protein
MRADTGFPRSDVENDFLRARRRQVLARLAHRLRREPDDVNLILPLDEVVAALGRVSERSLGLQIIRLDSVVGTVDSRRDFDRRFRPTSSRVRARWERLALAQRRGEPIPPVDVYRVGDFPSLEPLPFGTVSVREHLPQLEPNEPVPSRSTACPIASR